jgi:hypothetical protein
VIGRAGRDGPACLGHGPAQRRRWWLEVVVVVEAEDGAGGMRQWWGHRRLTGRQINRKVAARLGLGFWFAGVGQRWLG